MTVTVKPKGKAFADTETAVVHGEGVGEPDQVETAKVEVPPEVVNPNGADVALDAEIEFGLQAIIPTGEYQNIRVIVGAKCRCEADTDVMDATFGVIKEWVDTQITATVAEIQTDE